MLCLIIPFMYCKKKGKIIILFCFLVHSISLQETSRNKKKKQDPLIFLILPTVTEDTAQHEWIHTE